MLDKERQDVINLFRTNMKYYLGFDDIQESITNITYLFWNAKYVVKSNMKISNDIDSLYKYLSQSTDEDKNFIWNICNNIRAHMGESNLFNILKYLDMLSEEKIIDIICEDYSMYSRYNISTPSSINELVYQLLEKNNQNDFRVIDICSYTGNFLVNYARKNPNYEFTGIDINLRSNIIAQAKLNSLRVKNNLINANVFKYNFNDKFDKIFCNYPFGSRINNEDFEMIKSGKNVLNYEFTKRIMSDWAFVNATINLLSDKGKAVVVMNNAGLYRLPDAEYRKLLVDNGYVEAVISLPERLFSNTGIATTLLILSKNNKKIKFISADKMILKKIGYTPINELNVDAIVREYDSLDNTYNTKIINIDEVKNNNYSLYTQNYMEIEKIDIKYPQKLNSVCKDIYRGYQVSSNEINSFSEQIDNRDEYKIVNITNIVDGSIDSDLTKIYPDNDKMDKYLLQDKDLLVSSKGTLSKFAVVEIEQNEKYIPSGNFTILRLDTNIINPYYLKIFFESNKGTAIINSIKSGGVLPAINLSQFKEINIPVPSLEEQKRIVTKYLAKTDEIKIIKDKLRKLEESLVDIANNEF